MTADFIQPATSPVEPFYRLYADLVRTAGARFSAEHGLGGLLVYSGEIGRAPDPCSAQLPGRQLLFAANIAGAASIAASADTLAQREAIRDGAVDFFVTSLEEALRILKNEIRKRQAVSVGVAITPEKLVEAMAHRGVLPDLRLPALLLPANSPDTAIFLRQRTRAIELSPPHGGDYVTWSTDRESARWLPKLSLCAQTAIPANDAPRQRWLRLAPRYLGRMAHRQHGVALSPLESELFTAQAKQLLYQACGTCTQPTTISINGEQVTVS
jgi:hypothetical protein